jgi:hypothetical protein
LARQLPNLGPARALKGVTDPKEGVSQNAKQSKAEEQGESRREAKSNGETPGGGNKDKQRE